MGTSSERQSADAKGHGVVRPTAISLGIIAIALALIAWAGTYSLTYQTCQAEQKAEEANPANRDTPQREIWAITKFFLCEGEFLEQNDGVVVALATVVIAAFTIILGIATHVLANETRRLRALAIEEGQRTKTALDHASTSADAASRTATRTELVQRAYVYPIIIRAHTWEAIRNVRKGREDKIVVWFKLKNYGQSAAFLRAVHCRVATDVGTPQVGTGDDRHVPNETMLAPGAEGEELRIELQTPFGADEANRLENAGARLDVYGHIEFDDVWDETSVCEFHFSWDRAKDRFISDPKRQRTVKKE